MTWNRTGTSCLRDFGKDRCRTAAQPDCHSKLMLIVVVAHNETLQNEMDPTNNGQQSVSITADTGVNHTSTLHQSTLGA